MTLIGPKPDLDVPALPTPWTTRGAYVYDANGVHVLSVPPNEGYPADRTDVAAAVAETINRDHEPTRVDEDDGDPEAPHTLHRELVHLRRDIRDLRQTLATPEAAPADSVDPLAHVRVGDPDPTAHRAGGLDCDAESVAGLCTREAGHPGRHIAGIDRVVNAVWEVEA